MRKKILGLLMGMLVVFALLFLASFLALQRNIALFGIGVPIAIENTLVMLLSLFAEIRILWAIMHT